MTVLKSIDNWRRRRTGGRAQNHRVMVAYEEKTILDYVDQVVENMPSDLTSIVRTVNVPLQFRVKRTA